MVSDPTSREWINRAVRGDVLAVQKLIMVHHARLRAIAYRRISPALHAKIEPEDVLQQVYTDAIQRIGELQDRGEDAFFRWLRRILESKLVDAHRYYHAAARDVKREVPPVPTPSGHDWLAARVALDTLTPSRIVARDEASALLTAAPAVRIGISACGELLEGEAALPGLRLFGGNSDLDQSRGQKQ